VSFVSDIGVWDEPPICSTSWLASVCAEFSSVEGSIVSRENMIAVDASRTTTIASLFGTPARNRSGSHDLPWQYLQGQMVFLSTWRP